MLFYAYIVVVYVHKSRLLTWVLNSVD